MQIIILLIFGGISSMVAASKGRSAVGWFFGGFFLGLIGLVIVLCLSNLEEEEQKRQHLLNEQRRLREQLRQERMRNQAFQEYTAARLDVHDGALELDTRSADAEVRMEPPRLPGREEGWIEVDPEE